MAQEAFIGLKDIYDVVMKLVGHMEAIDTRNKSADLIHQDHESRLRAIEKWRYALPVTIFTAVMNGVTAAIIVYVQISGK